MKYIQLLVFSFCFNAVSAQELVREYFLEALSTNDTLIIFCYDPQTDLAKSINNRIYYDSIFIQKIKNEFYEEYEVDKKSSHFCGYDLFFYKFSNSKVKLVNKLNSKCGLSQFACKENGLQMLLESGRYIQIDTLYDAPKNKNRLIENIIQDNVLFSKYENKTEWDICKTSKYPKFYYDGYFNTTILLDTSFSLSENIDNFLLKYSSNYSGINWNIDQEWGKTEGNHMRIKRFERLKENVEINISVYLKKTDFKSFKTMKIKPIPYNIIMNDPYLIFYKD